MNDQANSIQEVLTVVGRLNYAYLAQPFPSKSDDGKVRLVYKTQVLIKPDSPDVALIKAATRRVALAAWEGEAELTLQRLAAQDKLALHSGDLQEGAEYKGHLFISANGKKQPTVVATLGNPPANVRLEPGHAFYPYSGCKAAVMIALYAQSPKRKPVSYGPRINCQLMGVQFLAHDTPFGGGGGRIARVEEFGINPTDADASIPMTQADVGNAGGLL